jgi:hypothetical protein
MTDTLRAARSRQLACLADGQKPSAPRAARGDGEVDALLSRAGCAAGGSV